MIEACQHRHAPDLRDIHTQRIAKTWRTPIQKAGDADEKAEYEWLHEIADSFLPDLRAAFLRAVDKLRGTVDETTLRQALESGNVDAALQSLGMGDGLNATLGTAISKPLEDAFIQAGRETPAHTTALRGAISYRFDITNPESVRFLQSYDFGLIRQVSDETRSAIKNVVLNAMQFGGNPRVQAKTIRELVGLTDRQTKAVQNYRSALVEEERPEDQVERMTAKYAARMLKLRAENISRTETMRASNSGREAAWKQAQDKGLLSSTTRRRWLVTPDDRLCVWCAAIPALNPDGVPLGGLFLTPLGPSAFPPLHPQCRCVTTLIP